MAEGKDLVTLEDLKAVIDKQQDIIDQQREIIDEITNDYATIAYASNVNNVKSGVLGIPNGGTGASNASGALSNIGAAAAGHTHTPAAIGAATSGHTHTLTSLGAAASSHSHTITTTLASATSPAANLAANAGASYVCKITIPSGYKYVGITAVTINHKNYCTLSGFYIQNSTATSIEVVVYQFNRSSATQSCTATAQILCAKI